MSFNPLVLYDRDSDDSSSEGGYSDNHVAMGVGNDACGDAGSEYSLDSSLFTDASNDEMDGTGLEGNFNPAGLRIDAGKRVGIDTDDESDDDGEHGLYHIDKDVAYRGMEDRSGMRGDGGSISSGSFSSGNSSDDDIDWNMKGNGTNQTWLKTEKDVDDGVPVGSAREGEVVDAGHPSTDRTPEEVAETRRQGKESFAQQKREAEDTAGRQRNKVLVQEALAKARSLKGTARAHQVAVAERLAEGTTTGRRVRTADGNMVAEKTGRTLAPSLKAKGMSALRSGVSGALRGEVATKKEETASEREASAKAERNLVRSHSGMQKHAEDKALKVIKQAVRTRRVGEYGEVKPSYKEGIKAQTKGVALEKAKVELVKRVDKLLLSSALAKMREATRLAKARKIADAVEKKYGRSASVIQGLYRMLVAKKVISKMVADREVARRMHYEGLAQLEKGRDEGEPEAEDVGGAGGGRRTVLSATTGGDPRAPSMLSGGGGGAEPSAPAQALTENHVPAFTMQYRQSILREGGGYVAIYKNANVIKVSPTGGKLTVNDVSLTGNRANLPMILELTAFVNANKESIPKWRTMLSALDKRKTMIDAGRGEGKAQSRPVFKIAIEGAKRRLKKKEGGGAV